MLGQDIWHPKFAREVLGDDACRMAHVCMDKVYFCHLRLKSHEIVPVGPDDVGHITLLPFSCPGKSRREVLLAIVGERMLMPA